MSDNTIEAESYNCHMSIRYKFSAVIINLKSKVKKKKQGKFRWTLDDSEVIQFNNKLSHKSPCYKIVVSKH